jgi:thrombospondin type 3 repeat protein
VYKIKEYMNMKKVFIFFAVVFFITTLSFVHHIQAESGLPLEEETELEEIVEIEIQMECTDYDNGKNYYEKGKAEIREIDVEDPLITTEYDVCNEDGSLKEWYCEESEEGVFLHGEILECSNGCQNGACITDSKKPSNDYAFANNLEGKLLLQVEDHGRVWYIDFSGNKHEVTFVNALSLFEILATGITNNDLYQIPFSYDSWTSPLGNQLEGKLLLQVEDHGRIWYVDFEGKRHEATWDNLMSLFESLSLGITNEDLNKVTTYNDYDNDGLTDAEELNFYNTNPYDADSDGDGFSDGDEVANGYNPLGEGPLGLEFIDTDNDGLTDAEELNFYNTNPYDADSDGDGFSDGDEVANGYNPLGEYMSIYSNEPLTSLVYGGDNDDSFESFYVYGDYIYAIGSTKSEGFGLNDILIVKFNKDDLSIEEKKVYGDFGDEHLYSIYVDEDYIYAVGSSDVLGQGAKDALLIKFSKEDLSIISQLVYGGSQDESFYSLEVDEDYIYLAGYTKSVGAGESDTLLLKLDRNTLEFVDKKVYGGGSSEYFKSIDLDGDYIYAVGGTQSIGIGNNDLLIVKFNKSLEVIERRVLGNAADNHFVSMSVDQDYIYAVGQTKVITRDYQDALIAKFNKEDLDDVEFKAYGLSSSEDSFQDVYVDQDYIYAVGSASSSGNRNLDALVVRISRTDFNSKKARIFGGSKTDIFNEVYSDGSYIYTSGQTKLGDFYDANFTKIIGLEDGIKDTVPENFVWEGSNLDFYDVHLISTDSEGLDLNMITSAVEEDYVVLGSDSFSDFVPEEEEEVDVYTVTIATTTMDYNTFDFTIEPALEELGIGNFIFTEDEVAVIVSDVVESSGEELSTYTLVLSIDEEFEGFKENSSYEILVIEFIEEEAEEVEESLILTDMALTTGYQDSELTDSNLNVSKYIVKGNNDNTCENYACCSNIDCDDSNIGTIDTCINPYFDNAYCKNELIPQELECLSDVDCDDNLPCTTNICGIGTNICSYEEITTNVYNDGCCLDSVWSYEFVPWKLDNDCTLDEQSNSSLVIAVSDEIVNLVSNNPQAIILLQEFIYDAEDSLNHGTKSLIGKLELDNAYTEYAQLSGNGILIIEIINTGFDLEEQIITLSTNNNIIDIYLPVTNSSVSSNADYYVANDGSTYYSLYQGNGEFMSPTEVFIEQNLARENIID